MRMRAVRLPVRSFSSPRLVLVVTAVLLTVVVLASMRSPGIPSPVKSRAGHVRSNQPAITLGLRAARRGGGAIAVLLGSTVAVLTVTATLVFSASLLQFIDEPDRYGWPYDVAVLVNAGYDNPDLDAISATLDVPDSNVIGWGRAALSLGTQVNGTPVPVVGMREGFEPWVACRSSAARPRVATTRSRSGSSRPTSSVYRWATRY